MESQNEHKENIEALEQPWYNKITNMIYISIPIVGALAQVKVAIKCGVISLIIGILINCILQCCKPICSQSTVLIMGAFGHKKKQKSNRRRKTNRLIKRKAMKTNQYEICSQNNVNQTIINSQITDSSKQTRN